MAANINLQNVSVIDGPIVPAAGRLRVWGNVASLRTPDNQTVLAEKGGVVGVSKVQIDAKLLRRVVSFDDATTWTVSQPRRGCGCGR